MSTSLAQLLVHLDASPQALQRLDVACRLGQAHGAAVAALYAVMPSLVALPFSPEIGADMAASLLSIDEEQRARVRTAFDQSRPASDAHATWAEICELSSTGAFSQQALYADLLVLGQRDPSSASPGVPVDFVESVLADSGKPALILPYINVPAGIGETVVIAWKPTREAARAVRAAVPLLQHARSVQVLTWGKDDEGISGERLDLSRYLALHGVEAIWHQEGKEPRALGELLLSRAFDLNADLLVMGCYGHSRAREWVLGGTSRTVLEAMTLPVLMAH